MNSHYVYLFIGYYMINDPVVFKNQFSNFRFS